MPAPGSTGPAVYIQNTAPISPAPGDFWFDTSLGTVLNFRTNMGSWFAVAIPTAALDTLSNSVSVLSQSVSVVSNAVSVISQQVSVISQTLVSVQSQVSLVSQTLASVQSQVSLISQTLASVQSQVSLVSQTLASVQSQVSLISQTLASVQSQVSLISAQVVSVISLHNALSQIVSVISAGFGAMQMQVVAGAQAAFSAITKVSGLSVSLGLSTYEIEGMLLFSVSGVASVAFGFSVSTAVLNTFAGDWAVLISATSNVSIGGGAGVGGIAMGAFTGASNTQVAFNPGSTGTLQWARVRAITRVTTAGSIQMKATPITGGPLTIMQGSYLRAYKIG